MVLDNCGRQTFLASSYSQFFAFTCGPDFTALVCESVVSGEPEGAALLGPA